MPVGPLTMARGQKPAFFGKRAPHGEMPVSEEDPLPINPKIPDHRKMLIVGPGREQVPISPHCFHGRDPAQLVQYSWIVQVSGVQNKINPGQLVKESVWQRCHTVRNVSVRNQPDMSHAPD